MVRKEKERESCCIELSFEDFSLREANLYRRSRPTRNLNLYKRMQAIQKFTEIINIQSSS